MKVRNYVVVSIFALLASVAFAKPYGGMGDSHKGRGGHPSMEQLAALDLSAEQKTAIDELMSSSHAARKALRSEKRAFFTQLHDREVQSLSGDEIERLSEDFGRISAQGMRQRLAMKVAIANILTPEQRAKMATQRQQKREEMRNQRREKGHDDF